MSPGWEEVSRAFLAVPPSEILIGSDYDGTIAPIVEDPESALPLAELVGILHELVPLVRGVAVISGRGQASLRRLLPVPGLIHVGENGVGDATPEERARLHDFEQSALTLASRWPGVEVEAKPASVSIHFRSRPSVGPELERGLSTLIEGSGLSMVANRRVFDVQLRRAGKVRSMRRLMRELKPGAVFYAGDSRDDARVLRCLAGLEVPSMRVGVPSPEIPGSVFRSAAVSIDGPQGLAALLGELIRRWRGL